MTDPMPQLRIYDDRQKCPQPIGPINLNLPDGASDHEITKAIEALADDSRPYTIE